MYAPLSPVRNPMSPAVAAMTGAAAALALTGLGAWVLFDVARKQRRARYKIVLEDHRTYGPIAVLTYDGGDGFMRIHEFIPMSGKTQADAASRAEDWAETLTG